MPQLKVIVEVSMNEEDKLRYATLTAMMLWLILLALMVIATGCANRMSSSTDHHNTYPQVTCNLVSEHGQFHQYCCQGERCWYVY